MKYHHIIERQLGKAEPLNIYKCAREIENARDGEWFHELIVMRPKKRIYRKHRPTY